MSVSSAPWVPASSEDVELFLETELFIDVRIDNNNNHNNNNDQSSAANPSEATRQWLEAEVVEVKDRKIRVRFLTAARPEEW
jgi:hypothetical protein